MDGRSVDEIITFDSLRENVTGRLNLENWMVLSSYRKVHIFSLNRKSNGNLSIRNTICIDIDLVVKVFGEDDDDTLCSLKLYQWSQLQTLIDQFSIDDNREVDSENVSLVAEMNRGGVKNGPEDTVEFKFCDIDTKTEVSDFQQPLMNLIESSISASEMMGYNNTREPQVPFFHEVPVACSQYGTQNDEPIVDKTSLPQSQICSICNERCITGKMDRHMQQHFDGECYRCHVCSREYQNPHGLQKHVKSKHRGTKEEFFCDLCKDSKDFETKEEIENHMKVRHCHAPTPTKEQLLKCSTCDKEFLTLKKLTAHMKQRHDKSKWKPCPFCNKRYDNLNRHMNKHLNIRNHVCHICGSAYTQRTTLKGHIESKHTPHNDGQKKTAVFSCKTCDKTFTLKSSLGVHEKLHAGQAHICNECGQSFKHPNYLRKHLKLHKGDVKKRKCLMCDRQYARNNDMRQHMKKVHGVIGTTLSSTGPM